MTNDFLKIYENGTHGAADWKYYGDTLVGYTVEKNQNNIMVNVQAFFVDPDGETAELLDEESGNIEYYALHHEGWNADDIWQYEYNWLMNKIDTGIYKEVEAYKYAFMENTSDKNIAIYIENPQGTVTQGAIIDEPFYVTQVWLKRNGVGGYPSIEVTQEEMAFAPSPTAWPHTTYYNGIRVYSGDTETYNDVFNNELVPYLLGDQDPEIPDPSEPEDYEDTPITASDTYNSIIGDYLTNFTVLAEIDKSNLNIIAQALNSDISGDDVVTAIIRIVRSIVQKNIAEGILSIKIVPIPAGAALPYKNGISEKLFKPLGLPNVMGKLLNNTIKKYQIGSMSVHPIYRDYRDFMCEYSIYLPFSGIHRLDADIIVGNILQIYCDIDFLTGSIMYHLIVNDGNTSRDIYTFTGECAIELPITGTDYSQKYQTIMQGVFSGIGMIAGGAMGGPLGAGAGAALTGAAMSGLKTLGNAATVNGHYMQSGKLIPNSSVLSVLYPYLIISKPQDVSPDYKSVKGKPAHYMATLSSLRGFSIVSNINLSNISYATDEDKEALRSLLASGVYF